MFPAALVSTYSHQRWLWPEPKKNAGSGSLPARCGIRITEIRSLPCDSPTGLRWFRRPDHPTPVSMAQRLLREPLHAVVARETACPRMARP